MPLGVITTTSARAGAGSTPTNLASRGFLAGLTDKGPTGVAKKVGSYNEFEAWYGGPQSYTVLHDQVASAFAEGATELFIVRAVGPSATKGTLTLVDRAGSPLNTIRIDAIGAGAWSALTTVTIVNGEVTNTVTITITYATGTRLERTEVYRNVGPDPADIVALINARSQLVTATNLASATASPANRPAAISATVLSTGADDRASASAAVIAAAMVAATPKSLGPGVMAIPGYSDDTAAVLIPHLVATKREGFFGPASSAESVSSATATQAAGITAIAGAHHAAYLWPYILVSNGLGGTKAIDPSGAMIGARARTIEQVGSWKPVARATARFATNHVLGVSTTATETELETLRNYRVIALVADSVSTRPDAYWSLSTDENYRSLTAQAVLDDISHKAELALDDVVITNIDSLGVTEARVESVLKGICEQMYIAGGLYDQDGDRGYLVEVSPNPAQRRIDAVVSVRPPEAAEVIAVAITKVAVDGTL